MNGYPKRKEVEKIKARYHMGTRVELIEMNDPYRIDMLPGLKGTVMGVDDIATVHIAWDNGCHLGAAYGVDRIRKVGE